jgi:hypothetical protein
MTPSFGRELSQERTESLRAEGGRSRRPRRASHRRSVRAALGVRLVSAGLHLMGEEVR